MKLLLLLCVSAILALAASEDNTPLLIDLSIKPLQDGEVSTVGLVHGVSSCGGPGVLYEWRVGGCSATRTCVLKANGSRTPTEWKLKPSEDISALGVRIYILENEYAVPRVIFEASIPDSQVTADQVYVFRASSYINPALKDKSRIFQTVLYRDVGDKDFIESCAQAKFNFT